jgi:hypothetical protein
MCTKRCFRLERRKQNRFLTDFTLQPPKLVLLVYQEPIHQEVFDDEFKLEMYHVPISAVLSWFTNTSLIVSLPGKENCTLCQPGTFAGTGELFPP